MKISVDLINDKRLLRKLNALSRAHKRQIVRTASRQSAKPLLSATKAAAPTRTGVLKKSIKLRAARRSRVRVGVNIIIRKLDWTKAKDRTALTKRYKGKKSTGNRWRVFYASFVELGTKRNKKNDFMDRTAKRMGPRVQKNFMRRVALALRSEAQRAS